MSAPPTRRFRDAAADYYGFDQQLAGAVVIAFNVHHEGDEDNDRPLVEAVTRAARYINSQPCRCTTRICRRCRALGREHNRPVGATADWAWDFDADHAAR